jgi:hypothetical protein
MLSGASVIPMSEIRAPAMWVVLIIRINKYEFGMT